MSTIAIILPCYNPPENWEKVVVDRVRQFSDQTGEIVELIIVNDGSTRGATQDHFDYIRNQHNNFHPIQYEENKGKGYALREGVKVAQSERMIYTDIDFPYTAESLLSIYRGLSDGHDVVLGRRGKDYYNNTPAFRKFISKVLRWTLKTFLRLPSDDSQCGLKGFNKKGAAVFTDTRINRFLFDLEFIKLAGKRKLDVVTAEVELKPDVVFSRVNTIVLLREGINFLRVLFRK